MKQCPRCRNTYTDDTLRYCLADGAELTSVGSEPETLLSRDEPLRVNIEQRRTQPPQQFLTPPPSSSLAKVIAIAAGIGIVLVVGITAIGAFVYFTTLHDDTRSNKNVAVNNIATPDPEKQRLQDELANIQRRLNEQQKNTNRSQSPPPAPSPGNPGVVTARVNSPNDGFLALRDKPDANGDLIVKVPHESTVTIENCQRSKVSIGGRSGRWCLISWDGYEGYVFDAWLIY